MDVSISKNIIWSIYKLCQEKSVKNTDRSLQTTAEKIFRRDSLKGLPCFGDDFGNTLYDLSELWDRHCELKERQKRKSNKVVSSQKKIEEGYSLWDIRYYVDTDKLRDGFSYGFGNAVGVAAGGAVATYIGAKVYSITTGAKTGSAAGLAVAGPVGAVAGGIIGAGAGSLIV